MTCDVSPVPMFENWEAEDMRMALGQDPISIRRRQHENMRNKNLVMNQLHQ